MNAAVESQVAYRYWNDSARSDPNAVALANRLKIYFPIGDKCDLKNELMYPLRRLVVTGEDTEANFTLLFGPDWDLQIPRLHLRIRIEVLLCPAPDTAAHALGSLLDDQCPTWRPRGPSVEEEEIVKRVQDAIKAREQR